MEQEKKNNGTPEIFGLAAGYGDEAAFLRAAGLAREAGYRRLEVYTPFPVKGLTSILGYRTRIQWAVFSGGLFGGIGGFLMQYIANVRAYPLNIGGRPFNSWPAFIPITFEMTILFAALFGFVGFLAGCRLPEVHHPVFNMPGFARASVDRFFLCIRSDDGKFDCAQTRKFLEETGPDEVQTVNY